MFSLFNKTHRTFLHIQLLLIVPLLLISGCTQVELASHLGKKMAGSNVKSVGTYKVGSPYKIKGKKYYPAVDYNYNETGVASWYGPNFHGKKTANGEIFDQNELTAAHKTLPLPSIVRVTNLENGRSLIVRVNDRGPYAHKRIIDLSKRSAELLGFRSKGITKVRVKVLEAESRQVASVAKSGRDTSGMEVPMNRGNYKYASLNNSTSNVKNSNFHAKRIVSSPLASRQRIFVQTGAFSTRENAMKYASSLDSFGRAQISPIKVDGNMFFRVRLPAINESVADELVGKLAQSGYKNALIVVD